MFGYFFGQETFVNNIHKLLPGECIEYDVKKKTIFKSLSPINYSSYSTNLSPRHVIKDVIGFGVVGSFSFFFKEEIKMVLMALKFVMQQFAGWAWTYLQILFIK